MSLFLRTQAAATTEWYPYTTDNWATKVDKSNAICKDGTEQSPIDFPACANPLMRAVPTITWKSQTIQLSNNGHTVQLDAKDAAPGGMSYQISGTTKSYTLVQCHFHWPSEHYIATTQQTFEAHCVHSMDGVPAGGRYGVFGIFYEIGAENAFLKLFEDRVEQNVYSANKRRMEASNVSLDLYGNPMDAVSKRRLAATPKISTWTGPLDFKGLYTGVALDKYWNYRGSFTTPPCTEAVDFYIYTTKATMTSTQLTKFKNAIGWKTAGGNFRPPQPLNTRSIYGCTTLPAKVWYPYSADYWATGVGAKAHQICKDGTEQSPIDFPACANPMTRTAPTITWASQAVELINNGHTVQLNAKGVPAGGMSYQIAGGTKSYTLVQCHFHWPSEHYINTVQQTFEAHCVHTLDGVAAGRRYGVFGIFYTTGAENAFLKIFEDQLPTQPLRRLAATAPNVSLDLYGNPIDAVTKRRLAAMLKTSAWTGPLDFKGLYTGVALDKYWNYRGSFTTPPCTEAVDFYIYTTKATMTAGQLTKFKDAIGWKTAGGNYRPPQPLKSRTIYGCNKEPAAAKTAWYPYKTNDWATAVDKANQVCKDGKKQSPINFGGCSSPLERAPVAITWPQQTVELINNGHTVQITAKGADPGRMSANGKIYKLVQCHFHYPSEHTISTKTTPFEVHCVHAREPASTGRYGVLGLFYSVSATPNTALAQFEDMLPMQPLRRLASSNASAWAFDIFGNPLDAKTERRLAGIPAKKSTWMGPFDFKTLFDISAQRTHDMITHYWSYEGSFTTPPCTEAVDFYIIMEQASITQAQLDKFKKAIGWAAAGGNYRPPQPLNARSVYGCDTTAKPWYPYNAETWATGVGKKANQLCKDGKAQSPIDFATCKKPLERSPIAITWQDQAVELVNNGYTVQINPKGTHPGRMSAKGKIYTLVQCHFHYPSEHTIGTKTSPFEVHCVHTEDFGKRYGVLGLFYKVNTTKNAALANFEDVLPVAARRLASSNASGWAFDVFGNPVDAKTERRLASGLTMSSWKGPFDFKKMFDIGIPLTHYWSYEGSFTTPPCTEAVDFHIIMEQASMTQAQLDKFKNAIGWAAAGGNYRPPQPLNARSVHGCDSGSPWYPYTADKWATSVGAKSDMICKNGKAQSPIDFSECTQPVDETPIEITYPKQAVELINNGYTVQITAKGTDTGKMTAKGKKYTLVQCHWHWPSEHTIGTKTTPFEVHCVHTEDGGKRYGVLGLFYVVGGTANAALAEFEDQLPTAPIISRRLASGPSGWAFDLFGNPLDAKTERRLAGKTAGNTMSAWKGPFDFKKIFDIGKALKHFWHYEGSFTTPPCTEAVNFHILMDKASMTQAQLDKFKTAIGWAAAGGNYRPPQPLNARTISGCTSGTGVNQPWYPYGADKWSTNVGSSSNKICKDGAAQSPVDFIGCKSPLERTPIAITYPEQAVEMINNGHTVQITPKGADTGRMSAKGKIYTLVQCHFHWPSEHTINSKTTPFEVHCVHKQESTVVRYGVLGMFFSLSSSSNPVLAVFEDQLPQVPTRRLASAPSGWAFDIFGNPVDSKTERRLYSKSVSTSAWKGPLDFKKMFDIGRPLTHYWSYEGSFTTPPCTEAVDFYILMEQAPMTQAQLAKFKTAIGWEAAGGNYRPPQPLKSRTVLGCTVPQVGGGGKEEVDAAFQPGFTTIGLLLLASLLRQ